VKHARRHFQVRRGARRISADRSTGTRDWHSQLYDKVARIWRVLIATPIASITALLSGARPSSALTREVDEVVKPPCGSPGRRTGIGISLWDRGPGPHPVDEVARFIHAQVAEVLDAGEPSVVERHFREIHSHVAQRVSENAAHQWVYR
jgi:hypothetical protein